MLCMNEFYECIAEMIVNNMKNQKYLTVRTDRKSNIKIVERDKINTSNTQIHDL
jgi:ribosomal protein S17